MGGTRISIPLSLSFFLVTARKVSKCAVCFLVVLSNSMTDYFGVCIGWHFKDSCVLPCTNIGNSVATYSCYCFVCIIAASPSSNKTWTSNSRSELSSFMMPPSEAKSGTEYDTSSRYQWIVRVQCHGEWLLVFGVRIIRPTWIMAVSPMKSTTLDFFLPLSWQRHTLLWLFGVRVAIACNLLLITTIPAAPIIIY